MLVTLLLIPIGTEIFHFTMQAPRAPGRAEDTGCIDRYKFNKVLTS